MGGEEPAGAARVMMRFLELTRTHAEEIATLISMEHGKTIPDAPGRPAARRGSRRIRLRNSASSEGRVHRWRRPGIDMFSMRQPLGIAAGITPFNFPAMIPLWKCAPAIACGNAFILKPSERDPSCPMRLAELFLEAACRRASSTSSMATRSRSTPSSTIRTSPRGLRRLHAHRAVCLWKGYE